MSSTMKRGEVWWASLPAPAGSGPGYRRPVLVVQANAFNDSRIGTVVVAVITSNLALAAAPGNQRLSRRASGLDRASVVNVSQLVTLDRGMLTGRVKRLPDRAMAQVDEGLQLVLGL
jgi:mRNA interferase MazF